MKNIDLSTQDYIFQGDSEGVTKVELAFGELVVLTKPHPERESAQDNEDAFGAFEYDKKRALLVLADGMGGAKCGGRASLRLVEVVGENVKKGKTQGWSVRRVILTALDEANEDILSWGLGAMTTALIAHLTETQVRLYHVGDSVGMIASGQGQCKFATVSHSPVGYAQEAGFLSPQEAFVHKERNIILNAVGDKKMHVQMGSPMTLRKKDTLLLASDGLTDNLTQESIAEKMKKTVLEEALEDLYKDAAQVMQDGRKRASKPDDLSSMLYRRKKK